MAPFIAGHQLAYKAGVLHRDVSDGNVMIAVDKPFEGFIDDFDHSSLVDSSEDGGTALSAEDVEERDAENSDPKARTVSGNLCCDKCVLNSSTGHFPILSHRAP